MIDQVFRDRHVRSLSSLLPCNILILLPLMPAQY